MTLPMFLTWLRIAAIPLLVIVFLFTPAEFARPASAWIFGLASLTDFLDGYLARRWNQQSAFGAFLDPVADKLIVAVALVLLVFSDGDLPIVIATAVIIGREVFVSALREWMAGRGISAAVKVSSLGKIKTTAQMFAILFLLYYFPLFGLIDVHTLGYWLLMLAALLTFISGAQYGRAAVVAVRNAESGH
ncbi:CDP-diacylglycerol--glycerol-3-phosphate 3-phosphatidyltransferase [Guyparkeria hydrothermalis]|uniref:CDP-diacylglycerol--glycerol-3-phosphate 3-phosphatidyltransferase n=1 Tax=Guyparkeria hydrothermalis TaxID=923 RepID=UPI002022242D|nr:CDP-diacylglycerol--glycerol-3-phosphate 3-phosphatidyltransferase [Guyparkeria hydrothermalis]MCL7743856.1 CDP-diacylglycerol--glycerol-3-phosphate 3-phosphatidyltransferase [Guyparkeria hydrothermalis]